MSSQRRGHWAAGLYRAGENQRILYPKCAIAICAFSETIDVSKSTNMLVCGFLYLQYRYRWLAWMERPSQDHTVLTLCICRQANLIPSTRWAPLAAWARSGVWLGSRLTGIRKHPHMSALLLDRYRRGEIGVSIGGATFTRMLFWPSGQELAMRVELTGEGLWAKRGRS